MPMCYHFRYIGIQVVVEADPDLYKYFCPYLFKCITLLNNVHLFMWALRI